jgi:hypothetical protein
MREAVSRWIDGSEKCRGGDEERSVEKWLRQREEAERLLVTERRERRGFSRSGCWPLRLKDFNNASELSRVGF